MENMQEQMSAILQNPEMMQKIMSVAQSLNAGNIQSPEPPKQEQPSGFSVPNFDPGMLQKLGNFAKQSGIDGNQRTLLKALSPYLSQDRITRLQKAMQAAKMARMASGLFSQSAIGR